MSYLPFVAAAYGVFTALLAWDFLAARWQLRRALRQASVRRGRRRGSPAIAQDTELLR